MMVGLIIKHIANINLNLWERNAPIFYSHKERDFYE